MRSWPKLLFGVAAAAFFALLVRAHFPHILRLGENAEFVLMFLVAFLVPLGFLLLKEGPLSRVIDRIWFVACGFTVMTVLDWALGLGQVKYGLVSVFPIHLFTAYGAWVIATADPIEPAHVRRLWVAAVVALALSPLFNYG
jgi:hypothetical protein